jgi:8-oxo-dGTP pyrophosphatase MutT (NUDIX family)
LTARSRRDDLLAAVYSQLSGHRPVDGREARSRHQIIVAFGRLVDPFDTESDPTHVTGSALICGERGIVLLRHKRLGIIVQPGGHLAPRETPWNAALREGQEETGMRLRFADAPPGRSSKFVPALAHLDVHPGGRGHTHLDLRYLLVANGDQTPKPPPGESQDVRWYSWEEAAGVADPGLCGFVRWKRDTLASPTVA